MINMRVAFFTDTYEPQINGVVSSINAFAGELRKKGHSVTIFSSSGKKSRYVRVFKSIEFRNYSGYRIGFPYPFPSVKGFDIVHIHTPATIGLTGAIIARHKKLPVVTTFHTLLPEYVHYLIGDDKLMKKLGQKAVWKYVKWFYNMCDCIVAPSESIRKTLISHGISKKITIIPTGIKIREKKPKSALRKRYGFSKKDKIILHVGRITREKNILFIIKSLKKLLKEDVKFIITSDGPYKKYIEQYVKKKGLKNIIFTGFVSKEKLDDLYAMSDVFVFASKTETQGLVALEAMANSVPVVALDDPVVSEFVKCNGIGLTVDRDKFSKSVRRILNDRRMSGKFIRNGKKSLKKYNIEKCADSLLDLYSEMIKMHQE